MESWENIHIRKMTAEDRDDVLEMMEVFYKSDAVSTDGSYEIYLTDFENCIGESPYLDGYIFCNEIEICGYAMTARSFSTEFGRICVWIEDIYLKPAFRGHGIAGRFFDYIEKKFPNTIIRLEAERENSHAIHAYKKAGFSVLPYCELKKLTSPK